MKTLWRIVMANRWLMLLVRLVLLALGIERTEQGTHCEPEATRRVYSSRMLVFGIMVIQTSHTGSQCPQP